MLFPLLLRSSGVIVPRGTFTPCLLLPAVLRSCVHGGMVGINPHIVIRGYGFPETHTGPINMQISPISKNSGFSDFLKTTAFFDAYAVRVLTDDVEALTTFICRGLDCDFKPTTPRFGYRGAYAFSRGDSSLGIIQFEGDNVGFGVHVSFQGSASNAFYNLIKESVYSFVLLRADVAVDFAGSVFVSLARIMQEVIAERRLTTTVAGDWVNGSSRTLYTGSRKSIAYSRLYEKGDQLGLDDENTFDRFEVEFKPHKKDREKAATFTPYQFLQSSPWVVDFLNRVHAGSISALEPLSRPSHTTDHSRAFAHLVKQYRATMLHELSNLGGDSELLLQRLLFEEVDKFVPADYPATHLSGCDCSVCFPAKSSTD